MIVRGLQLVLIFGPSCSGKSECGKFLESLGFKWIEASDAMAKKMPFSMHWQTRIARIEEYFKQQGTDSNAVWALTILKELTANKNFDSKLICITGFRLIEERERLLKEHANITTIAIHSSLDQRFSRMTERNRADATSSINDFARLSSWEHSLGLARLMYESCHTVINDSSIPVLQNRLIEILAD